MPSLTLGVELKEFQRDALDQLRGQPYAFIGDDMGTGKTITCLARDFYLRQDDPTISGKPTLIVCEKTGLGVWRYHLRLIGVPDEYVAVLDNSTPKRREEFISALERRSALYYVVTYDTVGKFDLLLHKERRKRMAFAHVIADEAHLIKNSKAVRSRNIKKVVTKYRTAATGTPCDDKPWDIWSILNWLDPTRWNSYWDFLEKYAELDTKYGRNGEYHVIEGVKDGAPQAIRTEMSSFFVRRRLEDVVDMPELMHVEPPIQVEMTPAQSRMYKDLSWKGIAKVDDEFMFASEMVTRLQRQNMCSLGTLKVAGEIDGVVKYSIGLPSPKIDALREFVTTHSTEQHIIFTCYKDMSRLIDEELTKLGIGVGRVDGTILRAADRDRAAEQFQRGDAQVFVGTVAAAGKAITLTAGRHVLFTDRHWNPSKNEQAERRAWRLGQRNAIRVYDIHTSGTRDHWRSGRIDYKQEIVSEFLGGFDTRKQAVILQEITRGLDDDSE